MGTLPVKKILFLTLFASQLAACTSTQFVVSPNVTVQRGAMIELEYLTQDPLGVTPRLSLALLARGFDVRDASTNSGAPYLLRLTYLSKSDWASLTCTLLQRATGKVEATYMTKGAVMVSTSIDGCADAILASAKRQ